mmetsp:Transcript_11800/g.27695  ORF Transcript_11800/g.27695 Transcript_11800/m.27695 type:complete len:201 (+) Transcript_11800:218-820(+)
MSRLGQRGTLQEALDNGGRTVVHLHESKTGRGEVEQSTYVKDRRLRRWQHSIIANPVPLEERIHGHCCENGTLQDAVHGLAMEAGRHRGRHIQFGRHGTSSCLTLLCVVVESKLHLNALHGTHDNNHEEADARVPAPLPVAHECHVDTEQSDGGVHWQQKSQVLAVACDAHNDHRGQVRAVVGQVQSNKADEPREITCPI